MKPKKSISKILAAVGLTALIACFTGSTVAKSLYVISDNQGPTIQAWDIQTAPNYLVNQANSTLVQKGWGPVGMAIDTDSETLFVTFENSNAIDIVDATTFVTLATVTAPGATNLAGIAVDQKLSRVYAVDRGSTNLYVYDWDSNTNTLTLVGGSAVTLPQGSGAWGIALDGINDILYVTANSTTVYTYSTSDFTTLAGTITLSSGATGVAVDAQNQLLYTAGLFAGNNNLVQYDLANSTETMSVVVGPSYGGVGVAVDNATGWVYITTGFSDDSIRVYDGSLTFLHTTGFIGNTPTGLAIPTTDISFNPLNLDKDDGLDLTQGECVAPGGTLTYTISYDNAANPNPVNGVTITDNLPPEVDFVSATGGGTYNTSTHAVDWMIGTVAAMAPTASVQIVVTVKSTATPGGTISNSCTIDSQNTPPTTQGEDTLICQVQLKPYCQPDLLIGKKRKNLRADNYYTTTGAGQTVRGLKLRGRVGRSAIIPLEIQNDGNIPDVIRLRWGFEVLNQLGSRTGTGPRYRRQVFALGEDGGRRNVSNSIEKVGLALAPGEKQALQFKLTVIRRPARRISRRRDVFRAVSHCDASKTDVAQSIFRVKK